MNNLPRKILCEIINQKGKKVFENNKAFNALFNDLCRGEFKKERKCFNDSITEGIPRTLLKKFDELPYDILSVQLTKRLINFGFDPHLARWTVDSWALALGCIDEKSLVSNLSSLIIASNPAGAEIFVNDKFIGIAPVHLSDLHAAHYTIRVLVIGYLPWYDVVVLSEGEKKTIHANLIREIPRSEILIDSDPQGAVIMVDSHSYGTTPKKINDICLGDHELTLVLPDYEKSNKNITIIEGRNPNIFQRLTLKKVPQKPTETSYVAVDTFPSNAEIYLNGKFVGQTPRILKGITQGTYNLTLKLSGYSDFSISTRINPGKNPDIFWRFESQIATPKSSWTTYGVIAVCAAAILFAFFGYIPTSSPIINPNETQQTLSPTVSVDLRSNSIFLSEGNRTVDNLPGGYAKNYYFEVGNPGIIKLIRIRVEGDSNFDFIIGKDFVPTFIPKHYDRIADIGIQNEEMDISNLERGTYFIAVRNMGYSQSDFTITKTTFYK